MVSEDVRFSAPTQPARFDGTKIAFDVCLELGSQELLEKLCQAFRVQKEVQMH
jgi:hypothetical protein